MRSLALLVIVLNIPILFFGAFITFKTFATLGMIIGAFMMIVAFVNIIYAFKCGSTNFEKNISGRWWLIFYNFLSVFLAGTFLTSDIARSELAGVCLLISSLYSMFFLFNVYQLDRSEQGILAIPGDLLETASDSAASQQGLISDEIIAVSNSEQEGAFNHPVGFSGAQSRILRKIANGVFIIVFVLFTYLWFHKVEFFVPSDTWDRLAWPFCIVLGIFFQIAMSVTNPDKERLAKVSIVAKVIINIFGFLFITCIFGYGIVNGGGKLLNKIIGEETIKTYLVVENENAIRIYNEALNNKDKPPSYCVISDSFNNAFIQKQYCLIQADHFYMLPSQPIEMRFRVRSSFFGETIKGYYFEGI